jgi:two-component system chemotaxis response regulator CheY
MAGRNHRILIVEDQSEIRLIFEWALQKAAYEVVTSHGARQALRLIDKQHFDLIITDLAMPGMSGVELIEEVRAHPERGRTPILVITAHGWDQFASQARVAGCDGVLQKPVDPKMLRAEVDKYLRGWRFADGFEAPE